MPGDELRDYTRPLARNTRLGGDATAFADRFWPDGTARLTAYEYQGLLQSPCDELTCTDCHGMHGADPRGQIGPEARGDGALYALGDRRGLRRRARRAAILLDTMVDDPYPALRHIAHGSLVRLLGELPPGFIPEADRDERRGWVEAASPGFELDLPPRTEVAALRDQAANEAISIGE